MRVRTRRAGRTRGAGIAGIVSMSARDRQAGATPATTARRPVMDRQEISEQERKERREAAAPCPTNHRRQGLNGIEGYSWISGS